MEVKPITAEIAAPITTGTATTVSDGVNIRVINTTTAVHLVTIVVAAGGAVVGSLSVMPDEHVIIRKNKTEALFAANAGVKMTALQVPRG